MCDHVSWIVTQRTNLSPDSAALLMVPSALVPQTLNVLLDPAHQDARRIAIVETGEHALDPRLLK